MEKYNNKMQSDLSQGSPNTIKGRKDLCITDIFLKTTYFFWWFGVSTLDSSFSFLRFSTFCYVSHLIFFLVVSRFWVNFMLFLLLLWTSLFGLRWKKVSISERNFIYFPFLLLCSVPVDLSCSYYLSLNAIRKASRIEAKIDDELSLLDEEVYLSASSWSQRSFSRSRLILFFIEMVFSSSIKSRGW